MKRKMLSSLLSIAMILSMTATAFAEEVQIEAVDGEEIIVEAQEEITEGVDIIADADIIEYGVGDNIERQQLATMLYRYARYLGRDTSKTASLDKFADAGKVSEYAKIPVAWCVQTGILSGKTANGNYYVAPKGFATRAECATMISQYLTTK